MADDHKSTDQLLIKSSLPATGPSKAGSGASNTLAQRPKASKLPPAGSSFSNLLSAPLAGLDACKRPVGKSIFGMNKPAPKVSVQAQAAAPPKPLQTALKFCPEKQALFSSPASGQQNKPPSKPSPSQATAIISKTVPTVSKASHAREASTTQLPPLTTHKKPAPVSSAAPPISLPRSSAERKEVSRLTRMIGEQQSMLDQAR